ncbi:hypothetical protein H4Q26_016658 [Puccinia striiformis f. sp. tritici PST-130]|nr:hypothetical protein H4Q26_016658 [Puccinia striiformis f. sp. tritici PST-130]
MASAALPGDDISHHLTSPPRVRFDQANVEEEEEQTRLRRGSVSKDLRNQIALRESLVETVGGLPYYMDYQKDQGYATSRSFSRSQSEASIFRPDPRPELEPPVAEGALDNPSNTLWKSRYTQLNRVKSTSSVISGLNDDVLQLDYDRQAITNIPELDEGDGFDVEEMELDVDSSPLSLTTFPA